MQLLSQRLKLCRELCRILHYWAKFDKVPDKGATGGTEIPRNVQTSDPLQRRIAAGCAGCSCENMVGYPVRRVCQALLTSIGVKGTIPATASILYPERSCACSRRSSTGKSVLGRRRRDAVCAPLAMRSCWPS